MARSKISKALWIIGAVLAALVVLALLEGFHTIWFILRLAIPFFVGFVCGRKVGRMWPKAL